MWAPAATFLCAPLLFHYKCSSKSTGTVFSVVQERGLYRRMKKEKRNHGILGGRVGTASVPPPEPASWLALLPCALGLPSPPSQEPAWCAALLLCKRDFAAA